LALGVALPAVGALIPFVDLGGAENSPCSALITEAREAAKSKS
jgi:hypothetical protein